MASCVAVCDRGQTLNVGRCTTWRFPVPGGCDFLAFMLYPFARPMLPAAEPYLFWFLSLLPPIIYVVEHYVTAGQVVTFRVLPGELFLLDNHQKEHVEDGFIFNGGANKGDAIVHTILEQIPSGGNVP